MLFDTNSASVKQKIEPKDGPRNPWVYSIADGPSSVYMAAAGDWNVYLIHGGRETMHLPSGKDRSMLKRYVKAEDHGRVLEWLAGYARTKVD